MIRFLFRTIATVLLAVAVIMAVLDTTRTVAASRLVLTPLSSSWESVSPDSLEAARGFVEGSLGSQVWQMLAGYVLALPGFVVFLALAFLFYAAGRRPQRRGPRFAAEV
ncbi:MAG: hypothetical protein JNL61_02915 [Rhizobiaceae bacterium]|nr:hypothetical protein [Rhizobiaceae bacterium]